MTTPNKMRIMHAGLAYSLAGLILAGCGKQPPTSVNPFSSGGHVTNKSGHGTAEVWGISFDVQEAGSNAAGSEFSGTISIKPEETHVLDKITLGDVKITIEKRHGAPITLAVNGKSFGTVEVGSTVEIDNKRNVVVNGTVRKPSQ